jgi:MFS family permease
MKGQLGRLLGAVSVFELGNIAATLLILRATDLLHPGRSLDGATQLAIGLYLLYNVAATLTSVPAGRLADSSSPARVLALGVGAFAIAYVGFAFVGASIPLLAAFFIAAGVGIGAVETAEHSAVASPRAREFARIELRGAGGDPEFWQLDRQLSRWPPLHHRLADRRVFCFRPPRCRSH